MDIDLCIVVFPNTLEERKKVHEALCGFAYAKGGPAGLTPYLKKITNNYDLKQIGKWIDLYSQVELQRKVNNSFFFKKKTNAIDFPYQNAVSNPFYTIDVTSKSDKYKAFTLLPSSTKSATQKSDKEFKKKVIKILLNDFLNQPTVENKKRLHDSIDSFIDNTTIKRGTPFVNGGLPSLGKNR